MNPSDDPLTTFVAMLTATPATIIFTTLASLWTLEHLDDLERRCYTRRPRPHEAGREPGATASIDGRLFDGVEHPFHAAWWGRDSWGSLRLRIIPFAGPPEGLGVMSGPILAIEGSDDVPPVGAPAEEGSRP